MASMVMSALTVVEPRSMDTTPLTAPSLTAEMVPLSWLRAEIFMSVPFGRFAAFGGEMMGAQRLIADVVRTERSRPWAWRPAPFAVIAVLQPAKPR